MTTVKFGLGGPNKNAFGSSKPLPGKRKTIFDDDSDDDDQNNNNIESLDTFDASTNSQPAPPSPSKNAASKSKDPSIPPSRPLRKLHDPEHKPSLSSLQSARKQQEDALKLDPTIYDYDAAHDAIAAARKSQQAAKEASRTSSEPRYMTSLLSAAETRKRDLLQAKERILQKEREAEGDEFADKEKFVTEAYKQQQEELKKAEEEETLREEEARRKAAKGIGNGMQGFYKDLMGKEDEVHRAAVEAAARAGKDGGSREEEEDEEDIWEVQQKDKLREIREAGGEVVLNEDGEVADKRQLLAAGLNIAPSRKKDSQKPGEGAQKKEAPKVVLHQGGDSSRRAMRERQSRMVAQQYEQAAKRKAEEDVAEQEKLEKAAKSTKTEKDISSARERYLQRKKEAAAAGGK
ncbi:MAG: hypothetical protein M1820_009157 [Bogoriella megaspora]|nr:MAG: hypothetical protein M1820_009157 [Bogoriella megaspora]